MKRDVTTMLKPARLLFLLILLTVIVRIGFLLVFEQTLNFDIPGNAIHGSEGYDEYALNLIDTGIYGRVPGIPDAQIPPLYSYVLAAVYALFGRGYMQVGILNTLMDVFSILFLVDICRRLFNQATLWKQSIGVWVGLLAGLFYALYPYLIFQNLTVIDTPLWILFLHAFTWFMIRIREGEAFTRQTGLFIIGGGLVLGLSILARPIIPFFAVFVALWFLFRHSLWQTVLRLIPVALIGVMVVVPWIVRNYTIFDAFVPMTTTSGANLWQGNSKWVIPVFRAGYDVQWTAPENLTAPRYSREADSERFQLAVQFWQENPEKIPELLWVKFLIHWHYQITPLYNPQPGESFALDDDGNFFIARGETVTGVTASNVTYSDGSLLDTVGRPIHALYFGGLLLLAIVGILVSLRYWRDVSILYFVQISMTITYMIFHPSTRYRAPSDPVLFALSAYTVVWFIMRYQSYRRSRQIDAST